MDEYDKQMVEWFERMKDQALENYINDRFDAEIEANRKRYTEIDFPEWEGGY